MMTYVTLFSKSKCTTECDNSINIKLQTPISGFSKVGASEFIYNLDELNVFLSDVECKMHLEFDLKTDKTNVLFKDVNDYSCQITPYDFFNQDIDNQLFYSCFTYTNILKKTYTTFNVRTGSNYKCHSCKWTPLYIIQQII